MKFTLFRNIFVMSCLLLFQTKVASNIGAAKNNKPPNSISENLLNWNDHQKIKLLPHQLTPINYLEQHSEIKGLLVYHYLGTGKTFLALGFAERNPNKEIVILVPRFLKGHWSKNMNNYGVRKPKRYKIIAHNEIHKLLNTNLSNTIIILDESHRIISKLFSPEPKTSELYSKLYLNIQKASRILSLTGTPISNNNIDIAYQINLVAGEEVIPYNKENFRTQFMEINQHKSFSIGHIAESKLTPLIFGLTGFGSAITLGASASIVTIAAISGYFTPTLIKSLFPVKTNPLREFNADKLKSISSKYITYYDFDNSNSNLYPTKTINYKNISFNNYQNDFLIRFADNQLTVKEIVQLQKDKGMNYKNDYIALHSTKIQESMKNTVGTGLEIGNLLYEESNSSGKITYPYKFKEILDLMLSTRGSVVLYSHFYHNGILLFKKYLDSQEQKDNYAILHPDLSAKKYEDIINRYNEGDLKILLIHPEITEGISLIGTRQLHILETPFNKSLQEQIIGRAVRYKSHMHLPKKERHVDIYIWKATFSMLDVNHNLALRDNWQRNFSELNFYGERTLVDPNNDIKSFSPDAISYKERKQQNKSMQNLTTLLKGYSIETSKEKLSSLQLDEPTLFSTKKRVDPFEVASWGINLARYKHQKILNATGENRQTTPAKNSILTVSLDKLIYKKYINYALEFSNIANYSSNKINNVDDPDDPTNILTNMGFDTSISIRGKLPMHLGSAGDIAIVGSVGYGVSTMFMGLASGDPSDDEGQILLFRFGTVKTIAYGIHYFPIRWLGITFEFQNRFYNYIKDAGSKAVIVGEKMRYKKAFNFSTGNMLVIGFKTTI